MRDFIGEAPKQAMEKEVVLGGKGMDGEIRVKEVCGKIFAASEIEAEGSSDDRVVDQLSEDDESNLSEEEDYSDEEDEETFVDLILRDSSPEAEHNNEAREEIIKNTNVLFWELSEK
ncbi:hypothetical protein L2E82_51410 [Cichorium intybus]|nr:hypothetical protein L2E82_51410 [Cichorium intybus]